MRVFFAFPILLGVSSITPIWAQPQLDTLKVCEQAQDFWGCVRAIKGIEPDLRKYGPLQVDWSVWRTTNGSYVAPTFNSSRQGFYLAINCLKGKLNVSDREGSWKGWTSAVRDFELDLIDDLCTEVGTPEE